MIKNAVLSHDGVYRYSLSRVWDYLRPNVLFIMLNPSTADATEDDPTIRRCIGFAKSWGYGGLYVCNLYGYRTKSPKVLKELRKSRQTETIRGWQNCMNIIKSSHLCSETIFAWGASDPANQNEQAAFLKGLLSVFPEAKCLGKTKGGAPKHPLYLKADLKPEIFNPKKEA